jgi:hypothetical protein
MAKARTTSRRTPRLELNLAQWEDPLWRLHNLYWIQDEQGRRVAFRPNAEQLQFYHAQWYLNVILKARQLGFTTLIDLLALDTCVFNANIAAGIIAHNLEDAGKIFRKKVKYAYDNLPEQLQTAVQRVNDSATQLVFSNGSEISVGTSMRSGTVQFLHVSEFGKICRKYPDKAEEIVTGAFNAVHAGQRIYVESTAEGRSGHFYEMCKKAQDKKRTGAVLTPLDFKFHFYPWFEKAEYRIAPENVLITAELQQYFLGLETEHGIVLDASQRAWYAKKAETLGEKMKQEFPSTPDEAFEQALVGSYYGAILARMRQQGRITRVPHVPSMPVNTFWDLGRNDVTAIWFHQFVAGEHRFIRYFEDSGVGLAHYVNVLEGLRVKEGYVFGDYYLPHDAEHRNLEHDQSRVERLVELGVPYNAIHVVPRIPDVNDGIELVRKVLPSCWIDAERCDKGLIALEEYQKSWDDRNGVFRNQPLHNHASNGADAFRQFAQGYRVASLSQMQSVRRSRPRSHKVV